LNDNVIICNVGLSCDSVSVDQGRFYENLNINISLYIFN